ncbi:MAG TPA: small ribosomal subunit Rsm22 family protein, partial [Planctomycetota bacterium]|nr:small ribosomal subunit Rsm22 family protein [Planctomycetota bacterium]
MSPSIRTPPAVLASLRAEVERARAALPLQTASLRELFELFTTRRSQLPRLNYLDDPRLRLAYLRYHVPLNVARATCVLEDVLRMRPEAAEWENVVDLGAGPGSASLATLARLPSTTRRHYVLTDRSRGALKLARELLESTARGLGAEPPKITTRIEKLPSIPAIEPRSIVWLAMVLNELLASGKRGFDPVALVRRIEARMPERSILILVEPAQREPGRRLLEVRDVFAASRAWRILGPCTHARSCPLLRAAHRPWCHFHFEWEADPLTRDIARPLGLEDETGAFSYLAIERGVEDAAKSRSRQPSAGDEQEKERARVIGDPMWVAGGVPGIYLCRDGRRETLREPEAAIVRGDVVKVRDRKVEIEAEWPGFDNESRARRAHAEPSRAEVDDDASSSSERGRIKEGGRDDERQRDGRRRRTPDRSRGGERGRSMPNREGKRERGERKDAPSLERRDAKRSRSDSRE